MSASARTRSVPGLKSVWTMLPLYSPSSVTHPEK